MRRTLAALGLSLAAVASAGCAGLASGDPGEIADDIAEYFGASRPTRHVRRLDRLHDPSTFAHVPDSPPTCDSCIEEIRTLGDSSYASWGESAGAVFILTRAATEDTAAFHRAEAIRALSAIGTWYEDVEGPAPGPPPPETEVLASLTELRKVRLAARGAEPDGARCEALLRRVGDFRSPLLEDPGDAGLRHELRILRAILVGVLLESRAGDAPSTGPAADRALERVGAQALRTALAGTLLYDGDPRVRSEAADALGAVPGEGHAGVLATAYGREMVDGVRRRVVAAAGAIAGRSGGADRERAVKILLAALDDDDRSARRVARESLGALAGSDLGETRAPWSEWWVKTGGRP
jgi:hypothetical protein